MTRRTALAAMAAIAAVAGCGGGGGGDASARPAKQVWFEERLAAIDRDPYSLTCGDQHDSALFGKRAHFALADETHITNLLRVRVAQSIFYAVTEICRGRPRSYRPGKEAVAAVKSGRYRVHVKLYKT